MESYSISLPNFEGPLDLLLFFIKRDELNIYDIPIARITQEFLEYVQLIKLMDLELAGEFMLTASSLMLIKATMLLPRDEKSEGLLSSDEGDPRTELVRRLLEYKRYKEAASEFSLMEQSQKFVYYRQFFTADATPEETGTELLKNVTLFDLLTAFKKALAQANRVQQSHTIEKISVTVEEQSDYILKVLRLRPKYSFVELVEGMSKVAIVTTFLALLELLKNRSILIVQELEFGEISILSVGSVN